MPSIAPTASGSFFQEPRKLRHPLFDGQNILFLQTQRRIGHIKRIIRHDDETETPKMWARVVYVRYVFSHRSVMNSLFLLSRWCKFLYGSRKRVYWVKSSLNVSGVSPVPYKKKDVSADSYWQKRHSPIFHLYPYSHCQHPKKIWHCDLKMNLNLASLIHIKLL
jgi:hypothetical protein